MTPQHLGHPAHCTNHVALCVIHKAHCVKRGCPSLSYVGAPLRTLFMLVGPRRTRARESRFSFPPVPSGAPTSVLYRAGNLALSAPHRGPDPGLCLSHPITNIATCHSFLSSYMHCSTAGHLKAVLQALHYIHSITTTASSSLPKTNRPSTRSVITLTNQT